ncbi:MAG: hypothetical protein ACI8P3_001391 [Saprospiraceae bacterium]|jgi:hypothetical protein
MQTIIQTPTNQLEKSLDFYTKLGFTILSKEKPTLVSDGKVVIEINPGRFARAGVTLRDTSWKTTVTELQKITEVVKTDSGYLLSDPSGVWINLVETKKELKLDLSGITPSVLGNYAGISLETVGIYQSLEIWETLGFSKVMGDVVQGWLGLENQNKMPLSIMKPNSCPHLFFNPSLTYFNGKNNPAIIQKIRDLGVPITEEISTFNKEGVVDNIIIRDPGGFGFFIFND